MNCISIKWIFELFYQRRPIEPLAKAGRRVDFKLTFTVATLVPETLEDHNQALLDWGIQVILLEVTRRIHDGSQELVCFWLPSGLHYGRKCLLRHSPLWQKETHGNLLLWKQKSIMRWPTLLYILTHTHRHRVAWTWRRWRRTFVVLMVTRRKKRQRK